MRESHLQRRQLPLTVESLLIEKPDNPIGFIVEFLQKKFYFAAQGLSLRSPQEPSRYPDQAGVALGSDALQHGRETVPAEVVADGLIEGIDDEDDDEDGADYVDDIPSLSKSSGLVPFRIGNIQHLFRLATTLVRLHSSQVNLARQPLLQQRIR